MKSLLAEKWNGTKSLGEELGNDYEVKKIDDDGKFIDITLLNKKDSNDINFQIYKKNITNDNWWPNSYSEPSLSIFKKITGRQYVSSYQNEEDINWKGIEKDLSAFSIPRAIFSEKRFENSTEKQYNWNISPHRVDGELYSGATCAFELEKNSVICIGSFLSEKTFEQFRQIVLNVCSSINKNSNCPPELSLELTKILKEATKSPNEDHKVHHFIPGQSWVDWEIEVKKSTEKLDPIFDVDDAKERNLTVTVTF